MRVDVKPIQATPSLSGEDAKRIMLQVYLQSLQRKLLKERKHYSS